MNFMTGPMAGQVKERLFFGVVDDARRIADGQVNGKTLKGLVQHRHTG
jgi:hypothetical protein